MAKKELTMSEFRAIIKEEAFKLKKRMVLENEKKALEAELKSLMNESYMEGEDMGDEMDDEIEEGLGKFLGLTDSPEKVAERKNAIMARVEKLKGMGYTKFVADRQPVDEAGFISVMEKNGYSGNILPEPKSGTIIYQSGKYGASRLGVGGASQGLGV
jgi:hypothetical protein